MATATVTAASIKAHLDRCGYEAGLVRDDYEFAEGQYVDVAAFAHYPPDARSACIAAINCRTEDPQAEVIARRELGAPLVFACVHNTAQVWKPGKAGAERLQKDLSATGVRNFFAQHKAELSPRRIYEAKTRGRLPDSESRLPFVDLQLLPFAEKELGERLTSAVVDVIGKLFSTFDKPTLTEHEWEWVYKYTFRLLAAKILRDKRVNGFLRLDLRNVEESLARVQQHYGSDEGTQLGSARKRQALEEAVEVFQKLGNLQHLTTETLADVYERALVTDKARELFGTHATPSYLVDYILWRLAPWIEEVDPAQLRVFEPACGHAPFLVGMVRLLRTLDLGMSRPTLSQFCRRRFFGIDQDAFAVEIARLSLTVADVPYSNGWRGVESGDMFADGALEAASKDAKVLLANPPFEGDKPLRLLQRTLPHLPAGAVFGVIVPTTLLFTTKPGPAELRKWLRETIQLGEVSLFPDKMFKFSDHECSVLLGRKLSAKSNLPLTVRCRRVREEGREAFKEDYCFTSDRIFRQDRVHEQPGDVLWVPELEEELWQWLGSCQLLNSIADMNQGVQYRNKKNLPAGAKTVETAKFPDAIPGYASSQGDWYIHSHPKRRFFNLCNKEFFRREGSGTTTGTPQVVLNYRAVSRGHWRLKPFVDRKGRPVKGNFVTVRPRASTVPLEYLWAVLCSPLANAYAYTHTLKRDILIVDLKRMPVPNVDEWGINRVAVAARAYLEAARQGFPSLFRQGVSEDRLHDLLRRMDSEVLRLYGLPARAEKLLLDLFAGEQRPGVPGTFKRYYPPDHKTAVPLYAYLSDAYQRFRGGESPALSEQQQQAYDRLIAKRDAGMLGPTERSELYGLQAEVDGRDYATQAVNSEWIDSLESERRKSQAKLGRLTDKLLRLAERAEDAP
jgi:hypothetical protein